MQFSHCCDDEGYEKRQLNDRNNILHLFVTRYFNVYKVYNKHFFSQLIKKKMLI